MPPTKVKTYRLTNKDFTPKSDAQRLFFRRDLENVYDICLGGSAYGGKTVCMIISSLLYVDNPQYRAAFFRRDQKQLENSGLLDEAEKWYKQIYPDVVYNKTLHLFTFPSGARIRFHGCEGPQDYNKFKGVEWHALYIEEATQFPEEMIGFLASRVRNPKGKIPFRIRMSTNPGDIHEEHIMEKYMPWIYKNCIMPQDPAIKAEDGQVLYYWADEDKDYEIQVEKDKPEGKHLVDYFSFCFIRTRASDLGDGQAQRLGVTLKDPIMRMQQLEGYWGVKPMSGMYFSELDFKDADKPRVATRIRYWDKAASGKKGDYMCGMLIARTVDDTFILEDCILIQPEVHQVKNEILKTAWNDGKTTYIAIEQEGGSAGKEVSYEYEKMLRKEGFIVHIDIKNSNKETASKIARAGLISPLVKEGKVGVIKGRFHAYHEMMKQLVSFPAKGVHDDAVDSLTGAIMMLKNVLPSPLGNQNNWDMVRKANNAPIQSLDSRPMYGIQ